MPDSQNPPGSSDTLYRVLVEHSVPELYVTVTNPHGNGWSVALDVISGLDTRDEAEAHAAAFRAALRAAGFFVEG